MAYNFDTIARRYDRMNRMMTLGLDSRWRKRAIADSGIALRGKKILDVACGTGDLTLALCQQGASVVGIDLSTEMMAIAKAKCPQATYLIANAEQLPFEEGAFDGVASAFGIRNFVHLEAGLREMIRVLKPGGTLLLLELSTPDSPLIRPFYTLYAHHIIPLMGSLIASDKAAYTYLPRSIAHFPKGDAMLKLLGNLGLAATMRSYTFGVCRLYYGRKT